MKAMDSAEATVRVHISRDGPRVSKSLRQRITVFLEVVALLSSQQVQTEDFDATEVVAFLVRALAETLALPNQV